MRACPGWLAPVKASVSTRPERSRGPVLQLRPRYPSSVYLVPRAQQGEVEEEEAEARETTRSCTHDGEHLTEAPDECRSLARSLPRSRVGLTCARTYTSTHTDTHAHTAFFHTCTCGWRLALAQAVVCVYVCGAPCSSSFTCWMLVCVRTCRAASMFFSFFCSCTHTEMRFFILYV